MKVPFIDISRFEAGFISAWVNKVAAMSTGAQFVGGAEVAALEARLSDLLEVKHSIGCANGTDALQLALRAVGVGAGDVVAIPNATFWATFEAVVNVGASAVTVDCLLSDGGMDIGALEEAIRRERPKAAILVHLYGWGSASLTRMRDLCRKEGVLLIEDGAQCFGATFRGDPVLKGALISTTSFYPAKVLGAAGDAGAVFTDNDELADQVRRLGNHGRTAHYGHGDVGWNSRLDSLQAAYLNLSLDVLDQRIKSRREVADVYRTRLPDVGLAAMEAPEGYAENGYCNVCLVADGDFKARLQTLMKQRGIGFGNIYPGTMASQPGAAGFHKGHFGGNAGEQLSQQVLNLPLFPYMTHPEIDYVIETVRDARIG